jgi:hypothetical protein
MGRDSNGNYTLPPGINPVVAGTVITDTWGNATLADVAASLTNSLSRDGRGGMTAPLRLADGTLAANGVGFANESNTGFYRAAGGNLRLSILGADRMIATAAGIAFPDVPTAPTAPTADNTTKLATTEYVERAGALKADLDSPTFTGTPTAPTAPPLTAGAQLATTTYADAAVDVALAAVDVALAAVDLQKADIDSPAFTGTPTAPTQLPTDDSTRLATTAFVVQQAFSAALPTQAGNAGKYLGTDGLSVNWTKLPENFQIGDAVVTTRDLLPPLWLPANGTTHLQSSYAALFAEIGLLNAWNPGAVISPPLLATTSAGAGTCFSWSSTGDYVAFSAGALQLAAYSYAASALTLLTTATPSTNVFGVALSKDGEYLAYGVDTPGPVKLRVQQRTGTTYAHIPDPVSSISGVANNICWNPAGTHLAIVTDESPFLHLYKIAAGLLVKLAAPAVPITALARRVAWSPDGAFLAVGSNTPSNSLRVYSVSGDVFTATPTIAGIPLAAVTGLTFFADNNVALHSGNTLYTITRSGTTFTLAGSQPLSTVTSIAADKTGTVLVYSGASTGAPLFYLSGVTWTPLPPPVGLISTTYRSGAFSPTEDILMMPTPTGATTFTTIRGYAYNPATEFQTPSAVPQGVGLNTFVKANDT